MRGLGWPNRVPVWFARGSTEADLGGFGPVFGDLEGSHSIPIGPFGPPQGACGRAFRPPVLGAKEFPGFGRPRGGSWGDFKNMTSFFVVIMSMSDVFT